MNVTCPNCATVYRVDPAKVPETGVRARCSICSAVFAVQAAPQEQPAAVTAPAAPSPPAPPAARAPAAMPTPAMPAAPPNRTSAPAPTPAPAPSTTPPIARPAAAPAHMPPAAPAAAAPPAAAPPPAPQSPAVPRPATTGTRPVNPFLSQDPALKARRLARALISDMVVYHPAKRQEGLRDGNLRELFDEEIKKSWEEYADQVGKDVAGTTPYFKEALNEILAGGRQLF